MNSRTKKILKVFFFISVFVVIALATIPFFIKVDQYRPQIVNAVNERIHGKLELGKLSLTLWGRIRVGIDGLKLQDKSGKPILSVNDAAFDMAYWSIWTGSPLITLSMNQPKIFIKKDRAGTLNVLSISKDAAAPSQGKTKPSGEPAGAGPAEKVMLPALAVSARIGITVTDATVNYADEALALTNQIDRLNLRVKDLSLSRATEIELWADLNTKMGTDLSVVGPLKLTAELTPEIADGALKSAKVIARFTADDLDIQKGDLFRKQKGVAANFSFDGTLAQTVLTLTDATTRFHNAEIAVKGQFSELSGADLVFSAKPIELKSWSTLIPLLKDYDLGGQLSLEGFVKGKPEALSYEANIGVQDFSAKGPMLKAKPNLNGSIQIKPDRVDSFTFNLKAPGNEMKLTGKVNSFSKPQVQFSLISDSGMDLDQWIEFPPADSNPEKKKTSALLMNSAFAEKEVADLDQSVEPLRQNPMMKDLGVVGQFKTKFIKAMGTKIDDIQAQVQFKNLVASISSFSMRVFEGRATGQFSTDLKPKAPTYQMKLDVSGFDMAKATESFMPSFKNTLVGKLTTNVEGTGASFNPNPAKKSLNLKGSFQMENAQFKTIDIMKMVNDAVSGALAQVGDKIPSMKGKKVNLPGNSASVYERVSGTFTINQGQMIIPDFFAKPAPKKGIEVKGFTRMGLVDQALEARWELIDSQRITGVDQVSIDVGGKAVKNVLSKGENDAFILPIQVGCQWSAPCPNYGKVPEYLGGIVATRLAKGAGEAAKSRVIEEVQKKAGQQIGDGLKKLFGR